MSCFLVGAQRRRISFTQCEIETLRYAQGDMIMQFMVFKVCLTITILSKYPQFPLTCNHASVRMVTHLREEIFK
jgi:hypothetical protein